MNTSVPPKIYKKIALEVYGPNQDQAVATEWKLRQFLQNYGVRVVALSEISSPRGDKKATYESLSRKGFDGILSIKMHGVKSRMTYYSPGSAYTSYHYRSNGYSRSTYYSPPYADFSYDQPQDISLYAVPSMKIVWVASGMTTSSEARTPYTNDEYLNSLAKSLANQLYKDGLIR